MLSDSIFESIQSILHAINDYNDYSDVWKKDIIDMLESMFKVQFKIDNANMLPIVKRQEDFYKKFATKEFNIYFYAVDRDTMGHCEDCMCDGCVFNPQDDDGNHDSCGGKCDWNR